MRRAIIDIVKADPGWEVLLWRGAEGEKPKLVERGGKWD